MGENRIFMGYPTYPEESIFQNHFPGEDTDVPFVGWLTLTGYHTT